MRNLCKRPWVSLLGVIAVGAVIGLGMTGCSLDPGEDDNDFTITGYNGGDAIVYAVMLEPMTEQEASTATSTSHGTGMITGNTVTWQKRPPAGTYTILVNYSSSYYKITGVYITSDGSGSANWASKLKLTNSNKPDELDSNATLDETIAKLDEIINHPGTPAVTKEAAEALKNTLESQGSDSGFDASDYLDQIKELTDAITENRITGIYTGKVNGSAVALTISSAGWTVSIPSENVNQSVNMTGTYSLTTSTAATFDSGGSTFGTAVLNDNTLTVTPSVASGFTGGPFTLTRRTTTDITGTYTATIQGASATLTVTATNWRQSIPYLDIDMTGTYTLDGVTATLNYGGNTFGTAILIGNELAVISTAQDYKGTYTFTRSSGSTGGDEQDNEGKAPGGDEQDNEGKTPGGNEQDNEGKAPGGNEQDNEGKTPGGNEQDNEDGKTGAQVTVTFNSPRDETITMDGPVGSSGGQSLTVSVAGSFTGYRWALDGVLLPNQTKTITLNPGGLSPRTHELTVFVTRDGVEYAKALRFIVETAEQPKEALR